MAAQTRELLGTGQPNRFHARTVLEREHVSKSDVEERERNQTTALHLPQGGEHKGTCVIHAMSQDADSMILWLKNLNVGLVYKGEGLPALTYEVLNKLIKQKERA